MRLLFVCQRYISGNDASTNIIRRLSRFYVEKGHFVDVISQGTKPQRIDEGRLNIFCVKESFWERKSLEIRSHNKTLYIFLSILRKIILFFIFWHYPNVEPLLSKRMVSCFKQNLDHNNYDLILAFFRPYFSLDVAMSIKKMIPKARFVPIVFDLIEKRDKPSLMPMNVFLKKTKSAFEKLFARSDKIFLPIYQIGRPSIIKIEDAKVAFYNFPTFDIQANYRPMATPSFSNAKEIVFLYAGTLSQSFRKPDILLDVLNELASKWTEKRIRLLLFISGDCAQLIDNYDINSNLIIERNEFVPKETLRKEMQGADFLVNITNNYKTVVPSKVFDIASYGKPLINVMASGDDGSKEYIDKYPLHFHVTSVESVALMGSFIEENMGKMVDQRQLSRLYQECTLDYFARQIMQVIHGASK